MVNGWLGAGCLRFGPGLRRGWRSGRELEFGVWTQPSHQGRGSSAPRPRAVCTRHYRDVTGRSSLHPKRWSDSRMRCSTALCGRYASWALPAFCAAACARGGFHFDAGSRAVPHERLAALIRGSRLLLRRPGAQHPAASGAAPHTVCVGLRGLGCPERGQVVLILQALIAGFADFMHCVMTNGPVVVRTDPSPARTCAPGSVTVT